MSDYVINPVETELARAKLHEIKTQFAEWIWRDADRAESLAGRYNELFNSHRLREYNGAHLTLPGSSDKIELRPEQKSSVWRIMTEPATMLAKFPGWGKTYVIVAALMEMRRLGLKRKGLIVTPNHLVSQFAAEFIQLYPSARVLMADTEDFDKDQRRLFCAKCACSDYDAIIIPKTAFVKLRLRPENEALFIREELAQVDDALTEVEASDAPARLTVKELEKARAKLANKLKDLRNRTYPDDTVFLEDTGVDFIAVDEVQDFKNLAIHTKMTRVAGVPTAASARALDLAVKSRWLLSRHGSGLIFSTGTPIANTLSEMFVWMLQMIPDELVSRNMRHFDGWAGTFGSVVTQLELKPEGSGFRLNSRFARFNNVPELARLFNFFADVGVVEDSTLPRPKIVSGRPIVVGCPPAPGLKAFIGTLVKRADAIRRGIVTPTQDNMLAVTGDGRKASLDLRLVRPDSGDFTDSKINRCVARVIEIHATYAADKATQLLYCDLSTPKGEGFSIYRDIREKLIAGGIPEHEIAFIHDYETNAERALLFRKVREGNIRIVLGSTEKMGTGMNVQARLIAEHHLDVPWRPCDIEQREGRILRFGNRFSEVFIYRWVTSGSFDAYIWNLQVVKLQFINSIMRAKANQRVVTDVDHVILSYEETRAIATGNPMIVEKAGVDAEVMRLSMIALEHDGARFRCRRDATDLRNRARSLENSLAGIRDDQAAIVPIAGDAFAMVIDGKTYTDRAHAGYALFGRAAAMGRATFLEIGSVGGFSLCLVRDLGNTAIVLRRQGSYTLRLAETPFGALSSIQHFLSHFGERAPQIEREVAAMLAKAGDLEKESLREFAYRAKLAELQTRQAELNTLLTTAPVDEAVNAETELEAAA